MLYAFIHEIINMKTFDEWKQPHLCSWTLEMEQVHVFCAYLNISVEQENYLLQLISKDEKIRANKYYFDRDRKHFIACRGLLRLMISRYLQIEPTQVQFSYGRYGKPELAKEVSERSLRFNLSHSHGLAIYAIAQERSVGIDLEYLRPMPDAEKLANRFFCTGEFEAIASLPQERKKDAFFHIWTFKEAYLKANGEGLIGLESVEVSLNYQHSNALLNIKNNSQISAGWSCIKLLPALGYVGALVVEGHGWDLQCFALDLDILR
jgi:4'-phosphopantetheinyl transferase